MKPRSFQQVLTDCAVRDVVIEQIALRQMTLRLGRMRWTLKLLPTGLWVPGR